VYVWMIYKLFKEDSSIDSILLGDKLVRYSNERESLERLQETRNHLLTFIDTQISKIEEEESDGGEEESKEYRGGFLRLENSYLMELLRHNLTYRELRVFLLILRMTMGFNKEKNEGETIPDTHKISKVLPVDEDKLCIYRKGCRVIVKKFMEYTGIKGEENISRILKSLEEKGMIIRMTRDEKKYVELQDIEVWKKI